MALPKRRQSKARSKKRRTHYKSNSIPTTDCPQCSQTKMPHKFAPQLNPGRGENNALYEANVMVGPPRCTAHPIGLHQALNPPPYKLAPGASNRGGGFIN